MTSESSIPPGMPLPAAGRHLDPRDGACLMEAATVLAGEPWSDHPRCVHPTVAALARIVNDLSSDNGRAALWLLLPDLIGTRSNDPRVAPAVILRTLDTTEQWIRPGILDRLARRRAARRLAHLARGSVIAGWTRMTDGYYRNVPAQRLLTRLLGRCSTVDGVRFDDAGPLLLQYAARTACGAAEAPTPACI